MNYYINSQKNYLFVLIKNSYQKILLNLNYFNHKNKYIYRYSKYQWMAQKIMLIME